MTDIERTAIVSKDHTSAAANILAARQGHPPPSEVQINMVHAMVLGRNSLNQLATGTYKFSEQVLDNKQL